MPVTHVLFVVSSVEFVAQSRHSPSSVELVMMAHLERMVHTRLEVERSRQRVLLLELHVRHSLKVVVEEVRQFSVVCGELGWRSRIRVRVRVSRGLGDMRLGCYILVF